MWGLCAGICTVITKKPNNRVLQGGFIIWLYCFFYNVIRAPVPAEGSLMSHREGFIQKIAVTF